MVYDKVSNQKMLLNLVITIRAVNRNRGLVTDELHSPLGVESLLAVLTRMTAKARESTRIPHPIPENTGGFGLDCLRLMSSLTVPLETVPSLKCL